MGNVWISPKNFNSNWLKNSLPLKLSDIFKQEWHSSVNTMSSCINYRLFKHEHSFEDFLQNLDPVFRIPLVRFRCSNIKIPVVLGWYNKDPIDECLCNLCNCGDVGDEFHYIMKCRYFHMERKNHIPTYYLRNPNVIKFDSLFSTKNKNILLRLSKFISIISAKFN